MTFCLVLSRLLSNTQLHRVTAALLKNSQISQLCCAKCCPVLWSWLPCNGGLQKISRVLQTAGKSLKILSLDHYLRCEEEWSVSLSAGALFM